MSEQTVSTASPEELAKFNAMADSWWDPNGKFRPLHQFNPVRLDFLREKLLMHFRRDRAADRPFEGLTLLDIGCGGGLLSEPLAKWGFDVTGIDAVARNIGTASVHAEREGVKVTYRQATPEDLVAEGKTFDVVLAMEVVEHVSDVTLFWQQVAALLKPDGALMVATLNRTMRSLLLAKCAAEYILRWMPAGTHDWKKFVKPSELAADLRHVGIDIKALEGLSYTPIVDIWKRSQDVGMNYLAYATKTGA